MQNKLIRALIVSLSLSLFHKAVAQKPKWGVFAGPQMTSALYKIQGITQATGHQTGLQAGGTVKLPFENRLYFGPAVYYSLKGYKATFTHYAFPPDVTAINNKTTIHTVEIAPLLQYDFSGKPAHFFIKAGPALDFGISGKEEFDTRDRQHIKRSMKFSFTDYGFVTAQAIVQLGYEAANGLFGFAHYGHGIGSLNNADNGPRIKHRIFGLSLGWYFDEKKEAIK